MSESRLPGATHCVLLCGLPGSGKTYLSRFLSGRGFIRICPDEEMWRRHGQYGVDFPRGHFRVRERPILEDLAPELRATLTSGQSVVFDHGLWTPTDRSEWQSLATSAGAVPTLVYLPVSHDVRWERIRARNQHANADANSIEFSEDDLLRFASRFHPPGPDEQPHIVYEGRPESVLTALEGDGLSTIVPTKQDEGVA